MLVACALYPLAALAGHDWFVLVLVAAVVVGSTRNFSEGALFRGIGDTTRGATLLRAHAVRTTVEPGGRVRQPVRRAAALPLRRRRRPCSSASASLLVARARDPRLRARARARVGAGRRDARERRRGIASLRANSRLRTIGWANLDLERLRRRGDRDHARRPARAPGDGRGHGERDVHRRRGRRRRAARSPSSARPSAASARSRTFIVAITVQGVAVLLFADAARRDRRRRSSTASSCSRTAPPRRRSTAPARPRSSTTTRGCSTWRC